MGAADVVPGVSGGTIAFITGIYEELRKVEVNPVSHVLVREVLVVFFNLISKFVNAGQLFTLETSNATD